MKIDSLKHLSKYIGSGCTPSRKNALYWNSDDVPWLKTEQLGEYRIYNTNEYVSNAAVKECNMRIYPPNTISLAMYGEGKTRGRVSLIDIPMTTNQACCNIQVDETKADYGYIFYYLRGQYENLRQLSAGVRKNLNADDIKNFNVCYPDNINYQKKISTFLFSIDDKIALNNRVNATLEAMTKTLYDYWFVQFDFPDEKGRPYKTSGGKMVYNEELGREIPAGWEVKQLLDIANLFDSERIPLSSKERESKKGTIPYYGATGILDYVDEAIFDGVYLLIAEDGSVEMPNGSLVLQYIWGKSWINNHAHILQGTSPYSTEYLYLALRYIKTKQLMTGSIQKKVTQDNLKNIKLACPSNPNVFIEFKKIIDNLFNMYKNCWEENHRLAALRDWLLPMLMNGQVGFKGDC